MYIEGYSLFLCKYIMWFLFVQIFEGVLGNEVCESERYNSMITCVLFSFDGNTVAVSLDSGKIEVTI